MACLLKSGDGDFSSRRVWGTKALDGSNKLTFLTVIKGDGKVGIGTTSPGKSLSSSGEVQILELLEFQGDFFKKKKKNFF